MRYSASITIDFVIQAPDKGLAQDTLDKIKEYCEYNILDFSDVDEVFDSSTSILDSENE